MSVSNYRSPQNDVNSPFKRYNSFQNNMSPRLKISLASSASDFPAKTQFELRSIIGIRPEQ